ncbi:MAG: DNA replication/repair protein RecF [Selenomonadaceae bacterium]|nr:DNA replication/repair protein RecF [Selenomonadaceae bacterium]
MFVKSLTLTNYRNYERQKINFSEGLNVFWGDNAQGKTNIVEAIYCASLGHSHRTRQDTELIKWEKEAGRIALDYARSGVAGKVELTFAQNKRRQISLNSHPISLKDLIGNLNTVLFSPEDLFLIKGAPGERRRFLDREISQASPVYYHELIKYNRLIKERNALLKGIRERNTRPQMLDVWDPQVASSAAAIVQKRQATITQLNRLAAKIGKIISGDMENLRLEYEITGLSEKMTLEPEKWYNEKLAQGRETDIIRATTGIGPHRDDLIIKVNEVNLKTYGSQGQQRTGALALKLAELEFLHEATGEYPILLLDDVMSELDRDRRRELMSFIEKENIQTMITATDAAYFPEGLKARFFKVKQGAVEEKPAE